MPDVSIVLKGIDQASDAIEGVSGSLGKLGSIAAGVATGGLAVLAAGVAAAGAAAGVAVAAWADMDEAMDTLTLKTGASGEALDGMTASVTAIYNSAAGLNASMGDIASVMGTVGQVTGATGADLETLTSQLMLVKQAQGEGAVGASEFARTMQAWQIPASQGGAVLDQMFAATQKFGISTADMSSGLMKAAGAFQGMGFNLDQTMGLLAGFSAGGLNTEKSIMAMSTAAGKFAKDGVDMRTGLDQAVQAIQHAGTATEATKIAVETFGAKAGPALATAIAQGKVSLDGLSKALGDTTGALGKGVEATMDFPEKMQLMSHKLMTALAPAGAAIADGLGKALDAVLPLVDTLAAQIAGLATKVGGAISAVAPMAQALIAAATGAETFGAVLGPVGDVLDGLFAQLPGQAQQAQAALASVTNAVQTGLAAAVAFLGPLAQSVFAGIVTVIQSAMPGITALASAVQSLLMASFQAFGQVATAVFTALQPYLPALQAAIGQLAGVLGGVLNSAFTALAGFLTSTVIPAITVLAGWLAANLPGAINAVAGFVSGTLVPAFQAVAGFVSQNVIPALSTLAGWLQANLPGAIETLRGIWDAAWQAISAVVEAVTGTIQAIVRAFHQAQEGDWRGFGETLRSLWDAAWQALAGAVRAAIPAIVGAAADLARSAWEAIKGVDWLQLGRDVVAGIARGISNGAGAVASAARDAASAALDAAKGFLGIQSPSRVMQEQIGAPIAAGIAVGILDGADLVADGLRALLAGGLSAGVEAMHELASAFRAVFLAFQGESEGLGGNAFTHVKRLIDSISGITDAVQDFLGTLTALQAFGATAAGQAAAGQAGSDHLVWLFTIVAQLGQRMALAARQAAEGFINNDLRGRVQALAAEIKVVQELISGTVGAVKALLTDVGGTGIEAVMNSSAAQEWLANLMGGIVYLAEGLQTGAERAVGAVKAASPALVNLANAMGPISTLVTGTVSAVKALLADVGGTGIEAVMNSSAAQGWVANLMGGIVYLAEGLKAAAERAAGSIPPASASLANLVNALQPLNALIAATVGVVDALHDTLDNPVVQAATTGPMAELWSALYQFIAQGLVRFASGLKAAAEVAAGQIPAASASLQNLANALQPFTGLVGATVKVIEDLHALLGNTIVQGAATGPMAEMWSALYEFIASGLVRFAAGLKSAVEAAAGEVPAASDSLKNLVGALAPLSGVLDDVLTVLESYTTQNAKITLALSIVGNEFQAAIAVNVVTAFTRFAADLARAAAGAVGDVAAASESLRNLGGALGPLSGIIEDVLGVLGAYTSNNAKIAQALTVIGNPIQTAGVVNVLTTLVRWAADLARAAADAVGTVGAADENLRNLGGALTPLGAAFRDIVDLSTDLIDLTPVPYTAIQSKVDSLLASMKDFAKAVVTAATSAGISEDMQAAATALTEVAGGGMDMLAKAMSTIKDLMEFKTESGPGWLQLPGGNNIWTQGSVTPGIPSAEAVGGKVTQLMGALKAIVDGVKTGVSGIDLGADPAALQEKLGAVEALMASVASIVKHAQALGGGAVTNLALRIALAFDIPDINAALAALVVQPLHVAVVFDTPDLKAAAQANFVTNHNTYTYQTSYVTNTNQTSISQNVTGGVAASTAQSALTLGSLFGSAPV